jgi:hypothetical protein
MGFPAGLFVPGTVVRRTGPDMSDLSDPSCATAGVGPRRGKSTHSKINMIPWPHPHPENYDCNHT